MGLLIGYMRRCSRSLYPGTLLQSSWNALQVFAEI